MRVWNKRDPDARGTYIGRPSKFGNTYVIGRDGDRTEVIAKFEKYLRANPALVAAVKRELRDRDVICWCAPLACHGDVLIRIANEP